MNCKTLFDVTDKVVFITGGSSGLGEMIATGFVQSGSKVYITSLSLEDNIKVATKLTELGPGKCIALPAANLEFEEECKRIVNELSKHEEHLDILVNNAGTVKFGAFEEHSTEDFKKVLDINLVSVFTLTQACLPLLKAKAVSNLPSHVINIGSVYGIFAPKVDVYGYSVSKAGLHHLTTHLSRNLAQDNILVNAIAPGYFSTALTKPLLEVNEEGILSQPAIHRLGDPEEIAGTCIYLSSRAGQYTTGAVIPVDGGVNTNLSTF